MASDLAVFFKKLTAKGSAYVALQMRKSTASKAEKELNARVFRGLLSRPFE
jgi:hypothetical protein